MTKKLISKFISAKTRNKEVNDDQKRNILKIIDLTTAFSNNAKILNKDTIKIEHNQIDDKTIILEAAHQPNYFPYTGVFKKAFLLNHINEKLKGENQNSIAFFGFADQNLSTSTYLHKNIIPGFNKNGVEKIGFNIKSKDKWKLFNLIEKPSHKLWENETEKIKRTYSGINSDFSQEIMEIMWKCYENANNFSELNAYIFTKICIDYLNLNIHFFKYSDINRNKIFIDETKKLLKNLNTYNHTFNSVIKREDLNIRPVKNGEMPLWYHCQCGGKVLTEFVDEERCTGICPVCKKTYNLTINHDFKGIDDFYKDSSFSAVARNMIFAEGLGTSIYISGSGGGLRYGKISDEISHLTGFNLPSTLAWISSDYYIGHIQKLIIKRLQKGFNIDKEILLSDKFNKEIFRTKINSNDEIEDKNPGIINIKEDENKSNLKAEMDRSHNIIMAGLIAKRAFSSTPSSLDLFINFNSAEISQRWEDAIKSSYIEHPSKAYLLKSYITYGKNRDWGIDLEKIPLLYHNLTNIPVIEIDEKHSNYQPAHR